jgi:hypothetical protein
LGVAGKDQTRHGQNNPQGGLGQDCH